MFLRLTFCGGSWRKNTYFQKVKYICFCYHSLSWLHWVWKAAVISFSEKSSSFFWHLFGYLFVYIDSILKYQNSQKEKYQNPLFHLVASLSLCQTKHFHCHLLGHLRRMPRGREATYEKNVRNFSPFLFSLLALPPLLNMIPSEPTLGVPGKKWFSTIYCFQEEQAFF